MAYINKCKKCSATIPGGKNFCNSHYQEALTQYQEELTDYYRELDHWNSLSESEKEDYDRYEENDTLEIYSGIIGFILGGFLWALFYEIFKFDGIFGVIILVISTLTFIKVKLIKIFVGRLIRSIYKALLYFIGLIILDGILCLISKFVLTNQSVIIPVLIVGAIGISVYLEISGGHHESAEPTMPSKPTP